MFRKRTIRTREISTRGSIPVRPNEVRGSRLKIQTPSASPSNAIFAADFDSRGRCSDIRFQHRDTWPGVRWRQGMSSVELDCAVHWGGEGEVRCETCADCNGIA